MSSPTLPSYGAYLRLDELLNCQNPPDFARGHDCDVFREHAHHDEMLFVIVHQVFELWFKQVLHDLSLARDILGQPDVEASERSVSELLIPRVTSLLGRVNEILRVCHSQYSVIETMPSVHFLAFRDELLPASGFQSMQFRELEILAGMRDEDRLHRQKAFANIGFDYRKALTPEQLARIDARQDEMSFRTAVFDWLSRTPVDQAFPEFTPAFLEAHAQYADKQRGLQGGNPLLEDKVREQALETLDAQRDDLVRYLQDQDDATRHAHAAFLFIASYREQPLLRWPYTLLEAVIEFEESLRLLRYRHARMVERMIGFRVGTGGSSGVNYLDHTAVHYRVFGGLLEGRSFLLPPVMLPELPHPELLEFRGVQA